MDHSVNSLEPNFSDAITAIERAAELRPDKRRHLRTSLAAIAKGLGQPPSVVPARYSAVRARMAALHYAPLGWTPKTLANHKSNAKAALLWFAKEKDLLQHGVALSPEWQRLLVQLTDPSTRYRLLPVMRFCSGMKIEPQAVDESVIDRFFDYRSRTTSRPSDNATRRILARLWNGCIGTIDKWPARHLFEPPVKSAQILPWTNFPEALRVGIDQYINNLAALGRSDREGRRKRPCKASTLTMRRRELVAAVRMADKIGVPISNLLSLAELVRPDVAEKILDAYCQQDGEVPKAYTINLAGRFVKPALIASVVNGKISAAVRGIESMI